MYKYYPWNSTVKHLFILQETHGPSLVICHETRYSEVLPSEDDDGKSPETVVRDRLTGLDQDISAFSKITYVGAKADNSDPSALLERLKEVQMYILGHFNS